MAEILCRVIDCHVFTMVRERAEYLLLKRAEEVLYAGSWRMVGGKIEPGEKAYETAIRELKEETGLIPAQLWAVPFMNSFYEASHDRINLIPVFAARVDNPTVRLSREHIEYGWFAYEEARELLPWPAQIEGLRIINEFIVTGKMIGNFVEIPFYKK